MKFCQKLFLCCELQLLQLKMEYYFLHMAAVAGLTVTYFMLPFLCRQRGHHDYWRSLNSFNLKLCFTCIHAEIYRFRLSTNGFFISSLFCNKRMNDNLTHEFNGILLPTGLCKYFGFVIIAYWSRRSLVGNVLAC